MKTVWPSIAYDHLCFPTNIIFYFIAYLGLKRETPYITQLDTTRRSFWTINRREQIIINLNARTFEHI